MAINNVDSKCICARCQIGVCSSLTMSWSVVVFGFILFVFFSFDHIMLICLALSCFLLLFSFIFALMWERSFTLYY